MTLSLDLETRSDVDLLKAGVYRYCESPHTDVLLASYRWNRTGPVLRWTRGDPCPADIAAHVASGGEIEAHNAGFERLLWRAVLTPRYGWPLPRLEQWRCIAVTAAAMSLPRSLDRLGAALDLGVKKDKRGKALIKAHSIPQGFADGLPIWNDDPAGLAEFHAYCDTDVITEDQGADRLVPLSAAEQAVYHLNERINDRGVRLDVRSAKAALQLIAKAKKRIDDELAQVTGYYVTAVTQTAALARWIKSRGVTMPSMDKDDVEDFLFNYDDLPDDVRRALELRQEGAKPSVDKIAAMVQRASADGRCRGVYLHHGAGQTGRFSSRGVQCHNMPKVRKVFEEAHPRTDILHTAIRTCEPEALEMLYGEDLGRPLHLLSDAVRSFLWAAPGHDLVDADFTSIEGVMAAWFAGEEWKLKAFRELFAGRGFGMYELFASKMYDVPVERVTKIQRAGGKVGELALGYQGGVGALAKMARQNKIKLPTLFGALWESADTTTRESAGKRFEERLEKHDPAADKLGREGWIAAELIKISWREAHPMIVQAWASLEDMVWRAVEQPGTKITSNQMNISYLVRHGFLWCMLPSGRCLAYGAPRFQDVEAPWADKTQAPEAREKKRSVTVMGVDTVSENWVRYPVYGGSLFNNVVQGSARDILVNGMFKAEAAGYLIVLHTHDQITTEVPRDFGDVKEFERIISQAPAWAAGMPLQADGWRGKRFRK